MFKQKTIQPLKPAIPAPARVGGAVDHIAAATGVAVLFAGVVQLVMPLAASPFTAVGTETSGVILAVLWTVLGGLLVAGGVFRVRPVSIFAADYLLVVGLAGVVVCLLAERAFTPVIFHGAVAGLGFVGSSFARLTDKAELKRDLRFAREQAAAQLGDKVPQAEERSNV